MSTLLTSTLPESVVSFTVGKIGELAVQEYTFLRGVSDEVNSIQTELSTMRDFLRDANVKGKQGNKVAERWVVEVTDAAYDAEDAIQMFLVRAERKRRRGLAKTCIYFFVDLCTLHKIGIEIKNIKTRINNIHSHRQAYNPINAAEGQRSPLRTLLEYRKNTAVAEDKAVVGFQEHVNTLAVRLTGGDDGRSVVSIVAMGGAGKTTLARKLYKCGEVKDHFRSNVAWVCVSQAYSVKELLQDISQQVMELPRKDTSDLTVQDLQKKLSDFLRERRYLIVLDDIWEKEAWDQLIPAFPDEKTGSRIMLTTRIKDVALYADRMSHPFELPLLSQEESWYLFLNKVFPQKKNCGPTCPSHLEEIGKQIVEKCGGLPLAISVIGGLLSTKEETARAWLGVLDSLKSQLWDATGRCKDVLELSYYDLPEFLKPCFLYLSIFPEDFNISSWDLIMLWIAEGFVQGGLREECKEDVAERYLEELVSRSMIQVVDRGYDGRLEECRVHDLLRELAISEAQRNHLFETDSNLLQQQQGDASNSTLTTHVRRLGIHHDNENSESLALLHQSSLPKLRSLLCFAESFPRLIAGGRTKLLRVLHLHGIEDLDNELADSVFRALVHLKYLHLWNNDLSSLPPSICKLYNLETLLLPDSEGARLPAAIWTMRRLRHLVAHGWYFDGCPDLRLLNRLHVLGLSAGDWIKEESLNPLSELRIFSVEGDPFPHHEVLRSAINKFVKLQALILEDTTSTDESGDSVFPAFMPFTHHIHLQRMCLQGIRLEKLPQIHELPPNLTELQLSYSRLKQDPMPTLEKLMNLCSLEIEAIAYDGKKMIASAQGFPRLRYLRLNRLENLEEWIVERGAMPALESLSIERCSQLKMLPEGLQYVTTLRGLKIFRMPDEFDQRLKKDEGEDWYKIQHIPFISAW